MEHPRSETRERPKVARFSTAFVSSSVSIIDSQHYELLTLADELHLAMTRGNAHMVMGTFLDRLESCLLNHFGTEEELMATRDYGGRAAHVLEHERARNAIRHLKQSFNAGSMPIAFDTMQFLHEWLAPHLEGPDRELIASLLSRPSGPC
ncbi:MAG: bacteriohemerythrin [Bryobacteraceae bacterium]|jgi:hemerythrin-like metal-binding protein